MRTNIVIDDELMQATLKATGLRTQRRAVEQGLRTLLCLHKQTELRKLRGKFEWKGDLDAMRRDRAGNDRPCHRHSLHRRGLQTAGQ